MGLQSELLGRLDELREVRTMTAAPWKTCSDEWALFIQREQEAHRRQLEIDGHRRALERSVDYMKEEDELFLRAFVSVLVEDLK
jgi:hypothetical protein